MGYGCQRNIQDWGHRYPGAALYLVLMNTGREELALMAALGGLVVVLMMVIQMIGELFDNVRTMFQLY